MFTLEEVSARLEIHDALIRYCRGVDRRDADLIASAYFPDAIDKRPYGGATSTPAEIGARAAAGFGDTPAYSQHHITNVTIELDIARGAAHVESYVIAMHPVSDSTVFTFATEEGGDWLRLVAGRYIDRFEHRGDEWRIATRALIVDWSRKHLAGEPLFGPMPSGFAPGTRDGDPSYAHLAQI
jgi:hypothetical protein